MGTVADVARPTAKGKGMRGRILDLTVLADMVSTTVGGGIVLARSLREPRVLPQQVLLVRSYLKLLFAPT